ncbi:oocyte zinc finger protein XlCOF7.1-like [Hyla sarda]|uniref:oocyte zinc finger protein XlCOF7.1-like n=1 Tax=Hyla sarda TaxID=327740 RepID=UPI0024C3E385|nr:oocyte zinc finger protein XlCOF7.1-like [Hyla sarda]
MVTSSTTPERPVVVEKILRVTLDIIHLLTGQDDVVVKRSGGCVVIDPPPPAPTRNDKEKILDLIHKMVELLSGERSVDTRKDILEDVAQNDRQTVRSSIGKKPFLERGSSPDEPDITSRCPGDVKSEKKSSWNITVTLNSCGEGNLQDGLTDRSAEYTQVRVKVGQDANDGGHIPTTYETEELSSLNIKEEPVSGDEAEVSSAPADHFRHITSQIKEESFSDEEESVLRNVKEEEILRDTDNYSSTSHVKVKPDPSEEDDLRDVDNDAPPTHALSEGRRLNVSEMVHPNADDADQDGTKCSPNGLKQARHQTAQKVFTSSERGKRVSSKPPVLVHQKIQKPLVCSQCGQQFVFKSQLISHQMNHTGRKTFSCQECGKSFGSEAAILAHMKLHAGKASYSCAECGKSFGQKNNLQRHLSIHTGEKPHACPECGKRFMSKSNLTQHLRVHRPKTKETFCCAECGKCYKRGADYRWHMLIHLGEK